LNRYDETPEVELATVSERVTGVGASSGAPIR
jgi:hypothetical protein